MTNAHDELHEILTEVLNEGVKGCLVPNDYAKGKIATAKQAIQKAVGSCLPLEGFGEDESSVATIRKALKQKGLL